MDVKQAIAAAKAYANDVFSGEAVSDLGVEEVERDSDTWLITLGLSRPWATTVLKSVLDARRPRRSYHVFSVSDETGEVSGFRMRDTG